MKILRGTEIAKNIKERIKEHVQNLSVYNALSKPQLHMIFVDNNKNTSQLYMKNKAKACKECYIDSYIHNLSNSTTNNELHKFIETLNSNSNVNGIIVQLPLPVHISPQVVQSIHPTKDVDGLTIYNIGNLLVYGML